MHHYLGAPLARLEARIAFETLLERFTAMPLRTADPPFRDHVVLRGHEVLPIGATMARMKRRVSLVDDSRAHRLSTGLAHQQ